MTLSSTWIELLGSAATVCELAGHWFVQSTLLIGIGLFAGRCFAKRGAAFTSVIYRTTLVAAVLCPLATWLLMQFGLTLGIDSLPALHVASIEQVAVYRPADPVSVAQSPPMVPATLSEAWSSTAPISAGLSRAGDESPDRGRYPTEEQAQSFALSRESSPAPILRSDPESTPAAVPPADTPTAPESGDMIVEMVPTLVINTWMATVVASIALVWLFGATLLLLRLAAAHVGLLRLRRAAAPASSEQQQLCWELSEKMGVWPPAVLTSPFVPGPCLAGVLRPAILLPDELPDVPLATVFVHELAHLRRRDCFWNVARQAVLALLFFQPLIWRLSRRMETTAEEVCDDYVVEHGADRTAYADILVSLAERAFLPASSAVVPLVTFRSLLGRRVARILDGTRRLSLSVSLTALALIVVVGLAATVGTGALGPAGRGTSIEIANAEEGHPTDKADEESATAPPNDDKANEQGDASNKTSTVAALPDADLVLHYRGRVLDPDGEPVAGAAVFFTFDDWGRQLDRTAQRMAATGADGWFDFQTRRKDFEPNVATSWLAPGVVITADGFGCAQAASLAFETTGEARKRMSDVARRRVDEHLVEHDPIVRLVRDDAPLTGRLVSTEGKPLAGARVVARRVFYNTEGSLDAWETSVRQPKADADAQYRAVPRGGHLNDLTSVLAEAVTDRNGRFTLHGIGRERSADIEISGEGLETMPLHVRTRKGEAVTLPYRWAETPRAFEPPQVYLGNDFLQVVPYAQHVSGRVIDAQTREPMAHVLVSGGKFDLRPGGIQPRITTRTDDQGRYTLHGLIVGQEEVVHVTPPAGEPYVPIGARVTTALQTPATCDFALRRGVWLRGKVAEKRTGQPLEGVLTYRAFANNLSLSLYPGFVWLSPEHRCHPDEAGNYQLAIPPGPGVISFMATDYKRFRRGAGAETITRPPRMSPGDPPTYDAVPSLFMPEDCTILAQVNPAADAKSIEANLTPEAGATIPVRLVDTEGRALSRVECSSTYRDGYWETVDGQGFDVLAYYPAEPRDLFFYDSDRDLAAYHRLEGPAPKDLTVVLRPAASVRGRLFDESGAALPRVGLGWFDIPKDRLGQLVVSTDDDGNFRIRGLVPGRRYMARAAANVIFGDLVFDAPAVPGETKDLGNVRLGAVGTTELTKAAKEVNDATNAAAEPVILDPPPAVEFKKPAEVNGKSASKDGASATAALATPEPDITLHYHGRVLDPDGKPAAGAKIFFHYWVQGAAPRGDLAPLALSDTDGWFDFTTKTSDFDALAQDSRYSCGIVATASGYGFAQGRSIDFETTGEAIKHLSPEVVENIRARQDKQGPAVLQLVRDDVPLVGQVLTIEGKPVAGARVRLHDVMLNSVAKGGGTLDSWEKAAVDSKANYYTLRNQHVPVEINTWQLPSIVPDVKTDAAGRFTIRGIGRERVAELLIQGPDIEASLVKTRTRAGEILRFGEFFDRMMGGAETRDTVYPHRFTFAAGPSKPVSGRITDADTGAPIAGMTVTAGQTGTFMGFGKVYVSAQTDADGRYRLEGLSIGKREDLLVWPGVGSGYVPVGAGVTLALDRPAPERDFRLKQGIWLRGQAIDKATGKPIVGRVQYFSRTKNPQLSSYPGFSSSRLAYELRSDPQGRFEMPIPPGPGIVTYMAMDHMRYRKGQGAENVAGGSGSDIKTYDTVPMGLFDLNEHVLREINPAPTDKMVEVTLPIEAGQDVYGKIVDPQGAPLAGGIMSSADFGGFWRTHAIRDNTFHVEGYYRDAPRELLFFNAERNMAGHYHLAGTPPEDLVVKLAPAGSIRGRLVDKQGAALARIELSGEGIPSSRHEGPEYMLSTDDDGNFLIRGLIPGRKYTVEGRGGEHFGRLLEDVTVEAGPPKDVGDVTLVRPEPKQNATAHTQRDLSTTLPPSKSATASQEAQDAASSSGVATASLPDAEKRLVIAGRVIGPGGQPIAAARVWLLRYTIADISWDNKNITQAETTTDAQGGFRLDYAADKAPFAERERFLRTSLVVAATAPGFGLTCKPRSAEAKKDLELTLPPATVKAQGQILDLEGRPLVGVQLRVIGISDPHNDMPGWIAKAKLNPRESANTLLMDAKADRRRSSKRAAIYFPAFPMGAIPRVLAGPFVTDAQGRVDLGAWGDNRLLQVEVSGPGIAKSWVHIITYSMPLVFEPSGDPRYSDASYFGADFRLTAEPEQVIQGTIADAEKGMPIEGAEVRLYQFGDSLLGVHGFVSSTTDADGRYVLRGLAKPKQPNSQHKLEVFPGPNTPYFRTISQVPRQDGLDPVAHDVSLRRAAWITGRATEKATGKPVRGAVSYYPFLDNEQARNYANFRSGMTSMGYDDHYPTAEDGSFRLPAIAGRGVLLFIAEDQDEYPAADGVDQIAGLKGGKDRKLNLYHFAFPELANALREVNIAQEDAEVRLDVELPTFASHPIRFVDGQGYPVTDVLARLLRPVHPGRGRYNGWGDVKPVGSETILRGFEELQSMPVIALAREKGLGAVHEFRKSDFDGGKAYELKLEPCATVKGRLIDKTGKPLSGISVTANWSPFAGQKAHTWRTWEHNINSLLSDAEGRFSLPELPPGIAYELSIYTDELGQVGFGNTDILAPGQVVDRGDLTCKAATEEEADVEAEADAKPAKTKLMFRIDSKPPAPVTGEKQDVKVVSSPGAPESKTATVRGRVVNTDGGPIAGADVAVIAMRTVKEPGGLLSVLGEIPAEGKTDGAGQFTFTFPKFSTKTHQSAYVIARAPGMGLAFAKLNPGHGEYEVTFKVLPEEPIRVRIVNVDGQPGVGVPMRIQAMIPQDGGGDWQKSVVFTQAKTYPAAWLTAPLPDKEGRLVLHGVPRGHGLSLEVLGDEQFSPQHVQLNTGMPEERTERDGTYRPLVKNGKPGEEVVLPLAPAQWFEGVVRAVDTNAPLAHAKVSIWASQQPYGSMSSVKGETDDAGHYRISAHPGIRFGINVIAPDGTPYLNYKTPLDEGIDWQTGEHVRNADITLRRGVLARGTIVDTQSGEPIAGASVQYLPESAKNANARQEILTGWQNMRSSDQEGRFNIVVLPGPGRLLVHGPDGSYILREIGDREIVGSKPGGQRNYAHAIEKISPTRDQEPLELRIALERGARIHGRIVNEQGSPINEVLVISGLNIRPFWLDWHGQTEPTTGNEFELSGLEAGVEYPTFFLEPKRRLAVAVKLKSTDTEPTIVLHPCVEAKARFVAPDGTPKAKMHANLHMVVKPGGSKYDGLAQRKGELAADEDFVSNIDRVNYGDGPYSDDDGRVIFPALIPGATYRLPGTRKGNLTIDQDFVVPESETLDLGDITYDDQPN